MHTKTFGNCLENTTFLKRQNDVYTRNCPKKHGGEPSREKQIFQHFWEQFELQKRLQID
jgi:hypothetical protein